MLPLRCGLIGLGYFGKHYVRLLQEIEGMELRSVANSSLDAFDRFSHILPKSVKRITDARAIFEDAEIDAVVIATPPPTHFSLAHDALLCGKHVLVEKPMVTRLEDAYLLREIVEKSGKVFMLGHQYCYNDSLRALKKNIGALGEARYIFAEQMLFGPLRADTGCLWDRATHELSIIDFLFRPGAIQNVTGHAASVLKNGQEDFVSFQVEFESGLLAGIACSWFAPVKTRRINIAGTCGLAFFDDCAEKKKIRIFEFPYPHKAAFQGRRSLILKEQKENVRIPDIIAGEPLKNQLLHFIECIKTGARPITDVAHGIRITEYLDQISKSIMRKDATIVKDFSLSLFIPIYNFTPELVIKNVKTIREFAEKHYRSFEIILVDDTSRAETKNAVEEAARLECVRMMRYENGPSRRENLAASFRQAKYDIVAFLDVDMSTDISFLLPLTEAIENGHDVVIGSRSTGIQARRERSRFVMSKLYNFGVRAIFLSRIKDHTCGFKAFQKSAIVSLVNDMGYDDKKRRGWFWDAEMLIRARRRRMRVKEIPVLWASDRESTFSFSREIRVVPYMISFWARFFFYG